MASETGNAAAEPIGSIQDDHDHDHDANSDSNLISSVGLLDGKEKEGAKNTSEKPSDRPMESERSMHSVPATGIAEKNITRFIQKEHSLRRRISAHDDEDSATYPSDCYSFLSLHGPSSGYFWFGLLVYGFQMCFLLLMISSVLDRNWRSGRVDDNPWEGTLADFIVTEASPMLRGAQIMSLLTYVLFADSSTMDIITAVHTFPAFSLALSGDRVPYSIVSCFLRFSQGVFATFAALVLVITSTNVIEVILNFTALNFISALDDIAFEFAKLGKYGPKLENEAKRIEHLPLPVCMFRQHKHYRFWYTVIPLGMIVMGCFFAIVAVQESNYTWETHVFRIQFKFDSDLQKYNGCYRNDFDRENENWKRDFYVNDGNNTKKAQFGFCIDKHQWYMYDGTDPSVDPCNATYIVHSETTDSFDIATTFLDDWFTSSHAPAELYFFEDEYDGPNLYCDEFLDNGICDASFNDAFNNYDSGDCCAATCRHSNCGIGTLNSPFGYSNTTGDGYPNCTDPEMVALTIHLSGFQSSHDPEFLELTEDTAQYIETNLPGFYNSTPTDTYLSLYCNNTKVLKCYINDKMENQTETVMVRDGAACDIRIENTTSSKPKWDDEPIWYVNYQLYHGGKDRPILFQDSSFNRGSASFEMIPKCYFKVLSGRIDSETNIDNGGSDPSSKALRWLMENEETFSGCRYYLLSRYALAVLNFAAPMRTSFLLELDSDDGLWIQKNRPDLCSWENIVCERNTASSDLDLLHLDISGLQITGSIATEIGLLSNLDRYDAHDNALSSSIPSEMGLLSALYLVNLRNNSLTSSIPTEIGSLTRMTELDLGGNQLTGSIPTEIGLLTHLSVLDVSANALSGSIPSEIGLLTLLTRLSLNENHLTGLIPTELRLLKSLTSFDIDKYPAVESVFTGHFR